MKPLHLESETRKELKGPSLTIKWASASSFFIFVVFTIFAVITYKSSVNLMVIKERENLERTVSEIEARLSLADNELSISEVYTLLQKPTEPETEVATATQETEGSLIEMDIMLAELGQPSLYLSIFNAEGKLLFESQKTEGELYSDQAQTPQIVTIKDRTGYLLVTPVYSETTHRKVGYIEAFYELSAFYEIRNRLLLTLIVLELVSLILSSVLAFLLSTYFLKPLKVLRDTMDTIRQNPQSTVHMPDIHTNDELTDIAEIFNEMLDRMRRYIEQQEQFVEDVSHELRTPVAVIEGHLNLLNRWGKEDPEILEESLTASLQEISRMKSLVQEMLDLSRAEQVDTRYANHTSNAKQVIYQVYNNFKMLYPEFEIQLEDELPQEEVVNIYRNHLEQLLIIILDNAVKYSTTRKEVRVELSKSGNEVQIAIQDFGEGIPEKDKDRIFHRFYRVDKARARDKGGNGLGLSIAKQLVENYKGRIEVESQVHKGTIFRIYIPIVLTEATTIE